eukprot:TRINITY_DN8724_c1_g1_i1.p1 TRINITY_DN8724_c1_g1~~TRINITY_DN8724_c1_g1_i1.p1  ORF type:complete len:3085 (+),score=1246.46 TRINITY_DN8724_c1_g1_i1:263-9517(+)
MAQGPFWRQSPYVGLLADPYVGGTPLARGHLALSAAALGQALARIEKGDNHSTRRLLEKAGTVRPGALGKVGQVFADCYALCEQIFADDIKEKPEKLLPVVQKISDGIKNLPVGGKMLVPAGWMGLRTVGWVMYLVEKESAEGCYSVVVVNGGTGLRYHPASPDAEKIKYKTCCKMEKVPQRRLCDAGFWLVSLLLFTKDPPSEYSRVEVVYDVLLPWLAEVTTDHPVEADAEAHRQEMGDILAKAFTAPPAAAAAAAPAASGLGASLLAALQAPAPAPPPAPAAGDLGAALLAALNPPAAPPAAAAAPPSDLGANLLSALSASAPPPAAVAAAVPKEPLPPRLLSEAFRSALTDPHAAWRSASQNSSHWKSALEACRYLLSQEGVSAADLKLVTLALRKEFLVKAAGDLLPCLRPDHPLIAELRDRHDAEYAPVQLTEISNALEKAEKPCENNVGDPFTPQDIIGGGAKIIGVYVSGSWCKPCQALTPRLVRAYEELKPQGLEIILVSADKTAADFQEYFRTMPWLAVPYEVAGPVAKGLGVSSIPTLLLFDAGSGALITADGAKALLNHAGSFPWEDRSILRPRVNDDDAALLNIGAEQFARKALKEHQAGRIAEGCTHHVHALCDAVLRAADAARVPDTAPIVTKSSDTDLAITPAAMHGDTAPPAAFEPAGVLKASPLVNFEHFVATNVKKYEGKTLQLTTPEVIDLLSIPTAMASVDDAWAAIQKCEEVCELLYKKAGASTTTSRIVCHFQIIAVIGGLFTDILPLPKPRDTAATEPCLWRSNFANGATVQKSCLETLHQLMLLYVSAWQSVERPTRGCDGERFLTAASVLCVYDTVLRQVYGDTDTLLVSALFNEDRGYRICTRLCQDGRSFESVAAKAEFGLPQYLLRLNDAQRYLQSVERVAAEELFNWRMPEKIEVKKYGATCLFLRKLLDRAGYALIPDDDPNPPSEMEALANWLTENTTDLADQHPEFIWTRDMSALYRFAATMETRDCELLRRRKDSTHHYWRLSFDDSLGARGGMRFMRSGPALRWDVAGGIRGAEMDIADLTVSGFNGRELRWGEGPIVHSPVDLERVLGIKDATEDDVVHCRTLPNYGGTLSKEESERLFSSLTTRYISIPLVLDFFASMDRHTYLFSTAMQSVLRGVLFEPGAWADAAAARPVVPHCPLRQTHSQKQEAAVEAALSATFKSFDEKLLGTPHGLLLNELRHSPSAVLHPLLSIARRCLDDLAACSVYSANAHFMSFILTLLIDVHTFADFAQKETAAAVEAAAEGGGDEAAARRRAVDERIAASLKEGTDVLAALLQNEFAAVLQNWRAEAERGDDLATTCLMHTFAAMIAQFDPSAAGVATLVSSASYVRNWHGFGLGRARSDLLTDGSEEGLTPQQRLLRFLQAQGIETGELSITSLEKYVSTTGRSRPLFLHIGRDVLRVPTLVRTDAATEDAAAAAKLPPWDLPETTLFRVLSAQRRRVAAHTERLGDERDAFLNGVVQTALRNPEFSYSGWEASGPGRYRAARAELHVDIQQSEVLWRNDALKPVPDSMTQFPDFETIFGREPLHCGVVRKTAHRHWVHLVGTAYDLEEWDEPDPADLGAGFPTALPKAAGALTDAEVAAKLEAEEKAKASRVDDLMANTSIWGRNKRRRENEEPHIKMDDGVMYQGVRYTRAVDAYSDEPWEHPTEEWAVQIVREVISTLYPPMQPLKFCFYLPDVYAEKHVDEVTLLGCDHATEENITFKEARVSRTDKSMEVWLLNTHGRRLFKTLVFATNSRASLHNLPVNAEKQYDKPTLRYVAGNMKQLREHGASLLVTRHSAQLNGRERYVPPALLQGLVPSCMLENFNMWLGDDGVVRGEALDSSSAWFDYCLEIHISPATGTALIHRRPRSAGATVIQLRGGEGQLFRCATTDHDGDAPEAEPPVDKAQVVQLRVMGFTHADAVLEAALRASKGVPDEAVNWLMNDANVAKIVELASAAPSKDVPMKEGEAGAGAEGETDVIMRQLSGGGIGRQQSGASAGKDLSGCASVLVDEGYAEPHAVRALELSGGDVDIARHWLRSTPAEEIEASISQGGLEREATADPEAYGSVEEFNEQVMQHDLHLAPLRPSSQDPLVRALCALLSGVEDLSHVLVWVTPERGGVPKAQHADPMGAMGGAQRFYAYPPQGMPKCAVPDETKQISVIELPRLRLKLQPEKDVDGVWRLYVIDQPGWFVCADPPATVVRLLTALPQYLLLESRAMEYKALMPNHDVVRPQICGVAFPRRVVPLRTSLGWEEAMDQRFYTYAVHVSRSFLVSSGVGPTLYLLLLHLLARSYKEAFRLTEGVCTDVALNPDEQWVFDQLEKSTDDRHPDAVACRLQISLGVLFSPVKVKWELHEEVDQYLTAMRHVSSQCTLTADELESVLRRSAEGTPLIKNKLALLSAGGEAVLKPPPAETPGLSWLKMFMLSSDYVETHCTRVQKLTYQKPEALEDKALCAFLWGDALLQDEVGGGGKKLGVSFLYDLVKGTVPMKANGGSVAGTLGELLVRWVQLKLARWGRETVDDGEVEGSLSRSVAQLAHMVRHRSRPWPAFPTDRDSVRDLAAGVNLYSGPGRNSRVRAFVDEADKEFMASVAEARRVGGCYGVTTAALGKLRKDPLSKDVVLARDAAAAAKAGLAGEKRRAAAADASCDNRPAASAADADALRHPLQALCKKFVVWQPRDTSSLLGGLPFQVPSAAANTPVAKAMQTRMDADVKLYAKMATGSEVPHFKGLTPEEIDAMFAAGDTAALAKAVKTLSDAIAGLSTLQRGDAAETERRIAALVAGANTIPLPGRGPGGSKEYTSRILFALNRLTRSNAAVDLPFLASCYLSTRALEDLKQLNPYAEGTYPAALTPILRLANRVAHASAVKSAAEGLREMLRKASGGAAGEALIKVRHAARAVADTLTQRRHYLVPPSGGAGGAASFDPRFLLFEFIFSIRLRKRQVEMVEWFRSNLDAGVSRVQQMIMGQGKTQVVSPLLVLMLADGHRLVTQVMPSALLQQSRAVFHACFGAPILPKKVFTLQFDRSVDDAADTITLLHAKLSTAAKDRGVVWRRRRRSSRSS